MKSIRDADLNGKTVLLRVDYNVPLSDEGEIENNMRIISTLPTIKYILEHNAKVILCSHLGLSLIHISEGFKVIGADVNGSETACLDYTKQVLIIGSEANGISIEAEKLCDELVRIPIYGKCESLNAAVAGGILMYKSVGY